VDEAVHGINADAVLVSIMADAILFHPASIKVLLAIPVWLFQSLLLNGAILYGLVLLSCVSLFGDSNDCGDVDPKN
jgi:hypothetical protein